MSDGEDAGKNDLKSTAMRPNYEETKSGTALAEK